MKQARTYELALAEIEKSQNVSKKEVRRLALRHRKEFGEPLTLKIEKPLNADDSYKIIKHLRLSYEMYKKRKSNQLHLSEEQESILYDGTVRVHIYKIDAKFDNEHKNTKTDRYYQYAFYYKMMTDDDRYFLYENEKDRIEGVIIN